jgi:DNA replication protein DnaC
MTAPAPALSPDLVAGLRRLKLSRIRAIAPEVCQAAKTQRWPPDEFLRTLIEAEIAARDESNLLGRVKLAGFPVRKTLDEFKVQASSVPQATFDYLAGLE